VGLVVAGVVAFDALGAGGTDAVAFEFTSWGNVNTRKRMG